MKAGIVGLPNVGKSTLFNCLSNVKAQSANFPFCTIEPNIGLVNIPDERLNKLVELISPEKTIPNSVEIVDIAGLVKGASKGEGLGNQFLSNIRETNAIIHVLRCYKDDNITHVEGSVDPLRDKEIIDFELKLKDLETLEKRKALKFAALEAWYKVSVELPQELKFSELTFTSDRTLSGKTSRQLRIRGSADTGTKNLIFNYQEALTRMEASDGNALFSEVSSDGTREDPRKKQLTWALTCDFDGE